MSKKYVSTIVLLALVTLQSAFYIQRVAQATPPKTAVCSCEHCDGQCDADCSCPLCAKRKAAFKRARSILKRVSDWRQRVHAANA